MTSSALASVNCPGVCPSLRNCLPTAKQLHNAAQGRRRDACRNGAPWDRRSSIFPNPERVSHGRGKRSHVAEFDARVGDLCNPCRVGGCWVGPYPKVRCHDLGLGCVTLTAWAADRQSTMCRDQWSSESDTGQAPGTDDSSGRLRFQPQWASMHSGVVGSALPVPRRGQGRRSEFRAWTLRPIEGQIATGLKVACMATQKPRAWHAAPSCRSPP